MRGGGRGEVTASKKTATKKYQRMKLSGKFYELEDRRREEGGGRGGGRRSVGVRGGRRGGVGVGG